MQSAPPAWSSVWGTSQPLDFGDDAGKQPGQLRESNLQVKVSEWERQIASADQRQAEIQHFQFHLVKDQISTFAKELETMRTDVTLLRGVVESQVGPKLRDLKAHADREAHERDCLVRRAIELKDLLDQERKAREAMENSFRSDVITLQTEFREAMAQFSAQEQQARETAQQGLQAQYEEQKVKTESAFADVELHFSQAMREGTELCMSKLSALNEELSAKIAGLEKKLSSSFADSLAQLQSSQDVVMEESRRHTEAITENKMGIASLKETNMHQDDKLHTLEESLHQDMQERRDQLSRVWRAMDSHTHAVAGSVVQTLGCATPASPSISSPLNVVPSVPGSLRVPACSAASPSISSPLNAVPSVPGSLRVPACSAASPSISSPLNAVPSVPGSLGVPACPACQDPATEWRRSLDKALSSWSPSMDSAPQATPWTGVALESPTTGTFSPTSSRPLLKMIPTSITVGAPEMSPMRRTLSQRTFSGATMSPQSPACTAWPERGSITRNSAS